MQERRKGSGRKPLWLVDYDLENKPCRRQFYREMRKLMGKTGLTEASSSLSVVATRNEKTARAVQKLAAACGKSNIYMVKQVHGRRMTDEKRVC